MFIIRCCLFFWIVQGWAFSYTYHTDGTFTSIHILVVDPKEDRIWPVRAEGVSVKRETVLTLAQQHGAAAAINGGFWKQNGDPAGILKIDNQWHGFPVKTRAAIGWSEDGHTVLIDRVLTHVQEEKIRVVPASSPPSTTEEMWDQCTHIVGGTPVLISHGRVINDFSPEQTLLTFLTNKHARTAVGIRSDGNWVCVVVDRFSGPFGGMTMTELATLMQQLDCTDALNLDGGGSSTMVVNNQVVNYPKGDISEKDKKVRAVSDAILIGTPVARSN